MTNSTYAATIEKGKVRYYATAGNDPTFPQGGTLEITPSDHDGSIALFLRCYDQEKHATILCNPITQELTITGYLAPEAVKAILDATRHVHTKNGDRSIVPSEIWDFFDELVGTEWEDYLPIEEKISFPYIDDNPTKQEVVFTKRVADALNLLPTMASEGLGIVDRHEILSGLGGFDIAEALGKALKRVLSIDGRNELSGINFYPSNGDGVIELDEVAQRRLSQLLNSRYF